VVKAIVTKEDMESHVYMDLLILFLKHHPITSQLTTKEEVISLITDHAPGTVSGLFREVMTLYHRRHGEPSVKAALLTLAVSPLPMTELVLICERLAGCPKHTILPLVLGFLDDSILSSFSDAIVNIDNATLCNAINCRSCLSVDAHIDRKLSRHVTCHIQCLFPRTRTAKN
jgi:hypothetical protein